MEENKNNKTIWIVVGIVVVILVVVFSLGGQNNNQATQTNSEQQTAAATQQGYSQHYSDYLNTYIQSLSYLYQSTQRYSEAQKLYGSNQTGDDIATLTSFGEIITDLQYADAELAPYTKDSDEKISASSTLLYADIGIELNDVSAMKSSYSDAVQNQDINSLLKFKTQLADFAAAKNTLESDLAKEMQIVKYIIQNTTENPNPTGDIDYLISQENRNYLTGQIEKLFPQPLDHLAAQNNIYLLWARWIYLDLSAGTYEQQTAIKTIL